MAFIRQNFVFLVIIAVLLGVIFLGDEGIGGTTNFDAITLDSGNLTVSSGNLAVTGNGTFTGNGSFTGTLAVTATTTLATTTIQEFLGVGTSTVSESLNNAEIVAGSQGTSSIWLSGTVASGITMTATNGATVCLYATSSGAINGAGDLTGLQLSPGACK